MRLDILKALNTERAARRAAVVVTNQESGAQRLGLLHEVRRISRGLLAVKTSQQQTQRATEWVILLGFFLIAVTLLGVTFDAVLGYASHENVVSAVNKLVPDDAAGKFLFITVLATIGVISYSVAVAVRG